MIKKSMLCVVSLLLVLTLTGCGCEHEWSEATCTTAKVCSKCEKQEGEPLGHSWNEATCTEPKTCTTCKEIEGSELGHIEGAMKFIRTNKIYAVNEYESKCERCSKVINSKEAPISSLIKDGNFDFSPKQYADRLDNQLNRIVGCTLMAQCTDNDSGDLGVAIGDSSTKDTVAVFLLTTKDEKMISYSERDKVGFLGTLGMVYENDSIPEVLLGTVLTFDPSLSFDEAKNVASKILSKRSYKNNGINYYLSYSSGSTVIGVSVKK